MNDLLEAGFAEAEFTSEPGLLLFGQMHERRGDRTRDPLKACAAAFARHDQPVVIVSVDVCVLETSWVRTIQAEFESSSGVIGSRLLIHSTHTHVAPATVSLMAAIPDPSFLQRLKSCILSVASAAIDRLEPVTLHSGCGLVDNMGWNRRALFSNGGARMYGHSEQSGFVAMEGPRDPAVPVIAARSSDGEVRGVLIGFSTHPNCLEAECFYSADIPGAVRSILQRAIVPGPVVVYLTGAAGNTAPSLLDPYRADQPWRGEAGLERSGLYLAGAALKVIAEAVDPVRDPSVHLEQREILIPIRSWPASGDPDYPEPLLTGAWPEALPYYEQASRQWPAGDLVPVRLNVVGLGDTAICTDPAELFVEYGLTIKAHSPARVTFISSLTDGYVGYVPTLAAFTHGGYETWPAPSSQLERGAGDQIASVTQTLLKQVYS